MPKITRQGGLTVHSSGRALLPTPADVLRARGKLGPYGVEGEAWVEGEAGPELTDLPPGGTLVPDGASPDEPLEESWPGKSSETSPEKPQKSDEPVTGSRRKRARTTDSRSPQGRAGSSSASSTGTSGPGTDA